MITKWPPALTEGTNVLTGAPAGPGGPYGKMIKFNIEKNIRVKLSICSANEND